jgi:hypothetical protein
MVPLRNYAPIGRESTALTDAEIRRAETAMRDDMVAGPRAGTARYDRRRGRIVLSLDNDVELAFPPELAEGLDKRSCQN